MNDSTQNVIVEEVDLLSQLVPCQPELTAIEEQIVVLRRYLQIPETADFSDKFTFTEDSVTELVIISFSADEIKLDYTVNGADHTAYVCKPSEYLHWTHSFEGEQIMERQKRVDEMLEGDELFYPRNMLSLLIRCADSISLR